ncbi:hypothetical protein IJF89_00900 [Candidatus Saccharibacteria bacterium]|nr:hypothetical protein [Candidatus Saccharibacteria bacterium]
MNLEEQLGYLRQVIPNFDWRCELFVQKWLTLMEQRRVERSGYWKMWFYTVTRKFGKARRKFRLPRMKLLPWATPFTDADHVFGLCNAVMLFRDLFGDYVPIVFGYAPDWYDLMERVLLHEVGEIPIGDWEDDGSHDLEEKWLLEWGYFCDFIEDFPREPRMRHKGQYLSVNQEGDEAKLFDKEAFLLGIIYAHVHDFDGDMTHPWALSKDDKVLMRKTKSKRCLDNMYAGMLERYGQKPWMPFFAGINEAAYRLYYTAPSDSLVEEGYEPGQVPAGVKQFYYNQPSNNDPRN